MKEVDGFPTTDLSIITNLSEILYNFVPFDS